MVSVIIFSKSRRNKILACVCGSLQIVAFLTNALAPGHIFRKGAAGLSLPMSIYSSIKHTFEMIVSWSMEGLIIIVILALIPLIIKYVKKIDFKFPWPLAVIIISFLLISSTYAPAFYSNYASAGPGRVSNCVYYFYMWWLLGNVVYGAGWLTHKITKKIRVRLPAYYLCLAVLAIFIMPMSGIKESTGVLCFNQLITGQTQTYDREMTAIYHELSTGEGRDIIVPKLTAYPLVRNGTFSDMKSGSTAKAAKYWRQSSLTAE